MSLSAFNSSKPASPPSSRSLSRPTASPDVVSLLPRRCLLLSSLSDSTVASCVPAFPPIRRRSQVEADLPRVSFPQRTPTSSVPSPFSIAGSSEGFLRCKVSGQRSKSDNFALRPLSSALCTEFLLSAQPAQYFEGATSWRKTKGTGGVVLINLVHEYVALASLLPSLPANFPPFSASTSFASCSATSFASSASLVRQLVVMPSRRRVLVRSGLRMGRSGRSSFPSAFLSLPSAPSFPCLFSSLLLEPLTDCTPFLSAATSPYNFEAATGENPLMPQEVRSPFLLPLSFRRQLTHVHPRSHNRSTQS
jgi:hypothetical protein